MDAAKPGRPPASFNVLLHGFLRKEAEYFEQGKFKKNSRKGDVRGNRTEGMKVNDASERAFLFTASTFLI